MDGFKFVKKNITFYVFFKDLTMLTWNLNMIILNELNLPGKDKIC